MAEKRSFSFYCAIPGKQQTKKIMKIIITNTYLLFTVDVHSSQDQTEAEIRSCTPYCDTPCNQQPKQIMEIRTILLIYSSSFPFIILRSKHCQTEAMVDLYFATPCHQQNKQTMEIRTILTYLLFTVPLHYYEE